MSKKRSALAAVTVSLLLFAGCSSSGGNDDDAAKTTQKATTPTVTKPADEPDETTTTEKEVDDTTTRASNSSDVTEKEAVDELTKTFMAGGQLGDDEDAIRCVSTAMVDIVGIDKLIEIGGDPMSSLDADTAQQFAETWDGCGIDVKGLMVEQFENQGLTPDQASCMYDEMGLDLVEQMLAAGMSGGSSDDFMEQAQTAAAVCV